MNPTHDRLADGGPRYTETPADPYDRFPAEPWNAVTAALFVLVAVAWLVRLRGRYRAYPFLMSCLAVLLVGAVGGTLYHALRTRPLYYYLDVVPIQLLPIAGAVFLTVRLWRRRGWLFLGGVLLAYLGTCALLLTLVLPQSRHLAVNLNYAALAAVVLLPTAAVLVANRFRHAAWVVAGLVAFAIAWFFRVVDAQIGLYLPMGSHWLWHTFGAVCTALVVEFYYRVEGGVRPARSGSLPGQHRFRAGRAGRVL